MAHEAGGLHRRVVGKRQATSAGGGGGAASTDGGDDGGAATTGAASTADGGAVSTNDGSGGGSQQTTTQRSTAQTTQAAPTTSRQAPTTSQAAPTTSAAAPTTQDVNTSQTAADPTTSAVSTPPTTAVLPPTTSAISVPALTPLSVPTRASASSTTTDFSTSIQVISGNPVFSSGGDSAPSSLNNIHPGSTSGGLSTPATAAIAVVASVAGVAIFFWLGVQLVNNRRRAREQREMEEIDFDPAGNGSNASGFGIGDDLHGALGIKRDDSLRARSDGGDGRTLAEVRYDDDADRREREEHYANYMESVAPMAPSASSHGHNQSLSSNNGVPTLPNVMSSTTMATSGSGDVSAGTAGLSRHPTDASLLSRQPTNPRMYQGYHPQPSNGYAMGDPGLQRQGTVMSSVGGSISRPAPTQTGYGYAPQGYGAPGYAMGYPMAQGPGQHYEGFDGGYQNGHVQGQRSLDGHYVVAQVDPRFQYSASPSPPPGQRELYNPNRTYDNNRLSVASSNGAPHLTQRRSLRNYASNGQMMDSLAEEELVPPGGLTRSDSVGTAKDVSGFGNLRLVEH